MRGGMVLLGLVAVLALFALARPLDHDESQYVAATVLSGHGLLPYRDFAYLQTPLQPLLLAPLAAWLGPGAWLGLRLVNAALGAAAIGLAYAAARAAGAGTRAAFTAAALFGCCDILLFGVSVARNDALPAALLAGALWLAMRAERGGASRGAAMAAGLLLAGAAAAKLSYALPAIVYGGYALAVRRHRPGWIALGAVPSVVLVGWLAWLASAAFRFEVFAFPALAPAEYYAATGRAWKLSLGAKAVDTLKFLALGPALFALAVAVRDRRRDTWLLDLLIVAGLVAALLPEPTWRQYLLPALPPLFVRLSLAWQTRPPGAALRIGAVTFAAAGLAPSLAALANGLPMLAVGAELRALAAVPGPVATLSPQFVNSPDPRFATGPFYVRSHNLLTPAQEASFLVVSRDRLATVAPPPMVLVGAEGWTSGDAALDNVVERWALAHGYVRVPLATPRLRLYAAARALPAISAP